MAVEFLRLRGARVLLIDDHEDLVANLSEILEGEGAQVARAGRASEALALRDQVFDVALVDIRLPDGSGLSVLPWLKSAGPGLCHAVLITSHATLDNAIAAVEQGAYAYMLKPVDIPELLATVGRALESVRLKRRSIELERRARIAEKLAAVGTLSAGLAHEIRDPLNAASLQLQLLERRMECFIGVPELHEPLALVRGEFTRLSNLVEDFLRFARPADLCSRRFEANAFVDEVTRLLRSEARRFRVALLAEPSAGPIYIDGDREKLKQVAINLIRNSLEALEQTGGNVVISLSKSEGNMVRLRVHDDGPGISEDELPRVFEPFYSTKPTGTGLGLAICHSLVQQHGGAIEVRCDHGTDVDILLPDSAG